MTITVTGVKKEVADGLTLAQLVIDEKVETPEYVTGSAWDDMFFQELKAFVDCVNTGEHIRSYVDENLITAKMMQGLYDSAKLGKEVSFE